MHTLLAALLLALAPASHSLTVEVQGVDGTAGRVLVGLYNTSEGWTDTPFQTAVLVKGENSSYSTVFENLPEGEYAVSVLHDLNGNNEMDTNLFGWPQEGFAFSNDIAPTILGAPGFKQCAFKVESATRHSVSMLYY